MYHWRWLARILFSWYIIFMIMIITCHWSLQLCWSVSPGQAHDQCVVDSVRILWECDATLSRVTSFTLTSHTSLTIMASLSLIIIWVAHLDWGWAPLCCCVQSRHSEIWTSQRFWTNWADDGSAGSETHTSTIITQWHTGGADSQPCKNKGNEKCLTTLNTLWT